MDVGDIARLDLLDFVMLRYRAHVLWIMFKVPKFLGVPHLKA